MISDALLYEKIKSLAAEMCAYTLSVEKRLEAIEAKYSPNQPRVPRGNPDGGQWTEGAGGGSGGDGSDHRKPGKPGRTPRAGNDRPINDPPIRPVYPIETALSFWFGGGVAATARGAIAATRKIPNSARSGQNAPETETGLTDHGVIRVGERAVTQKDISEAIQTAKKTGNVTSKIGQYGTLQYHYRGSNGLTVIVETQGRNAGKVITTYGKNPGGKL